MTNSKTTDKLLFFYKKFKELESIESFHFNDVCTEYCEMFYKDKSIKLAINNFKKYMKIAAENKGHSIHVSKLNIGESSIYGIKNIWRVVYN